MKQRAIFAIIAIGILYLAGCANSDDSYTSEPGDKIETILLNAVSDAHPGFELYVDSPDYGQWNLAAGKANLATGEAMVPENRLRMGSTTKTFTATLCLLLHEDGLLDFDWTLDGFLPDITVPHDSLITIEHLLNMTSGLLDYANDDTTILQQMLDDPEHQFTPEELVNRGIEITDPANMEPGTWWHYSNTNYVILGLIIEEVGGASYANQMRTRILEPLGLDGITVDETPQQMAHGYLDKDDDGILDDLTTWNPTQFWSAGCMVGTAHDLARFARLLFDGHILSDSSMELMQGWFVVGEGIPFSYGYGCGFYTDMDMIGHNGGTPGYAAEMWYHIPSGTVITVLSNSNRTDGDHTFNLVYEVGKDLNFGDYSQSRSMQEWVVY